MTIELPNTSFAVLYVDEECYTCKHLVGKPYAIKWDGRYYHERCAPEDYKKFVNSKLNWSKITANKNN